MNPNMSAVNEILEKLKSESVKNQVNVQVNEFGSGAYGNLMEKLLKGQL